jgi:hypothetical protein
MRVRQNPDIYALPVFAHAPVSGTGGRLELTIVSMFVERN